MLKMPDARPVADYNRHPGSMVVSELGSIGSYFYYRIPMRVQYGLDSLDVTVADHTIPALWGGGSSEVDNTAADYVLFLDSDGVFWFCNQNVLPTLQADSASYYPTHRSSPQGWIRWQPRNTTPIVIGPLINLVAGEFSDSDSNGQYGTPTAPDLSDTDWLTDVSFGGNRFVSPLKPSSWNMGAMRVATDGANGLALDRDGVLWYVSPGDTDLTPIQVVLPQNLPTSNIMYVQGVTWHSGTWWVLVKEVNEFQFVNDSDEPIGNAVSVDVGIFILTAMTIDPTDSGSWTLFRTLQANSGSDVGVVTFYPDNSGEFILGSFVSGQMTGVSVLPLVARFSDGTGVLTTQQTLTIPGAVAGTFTIGVDTDGTLVVNGGTVLIATVVVGNRPDAYVYTPFEALHFYNGGEIFIDSTSSTLTIPSPSTVTTFDGNIGGISIANFFESSLCAGTADLSVGSVPTDGLTAVFFFYLTEYFTDSDPAFDIDKRQLGVTVLSDGIYGLSFLTEEGIGSFSTTPIGIDTVNDHGLGFGGGEGSAEVFGACVPSITPTYNSIVPSEPALLGIGAGGTVLMATGKWIAGTYGQFDTPPSTIIEGEFQYYTGTASPVTLSSDMSTQLAHYTNGLNVMPVKFDGNQNVPVHAGSVVVDSDGFVDDSTSWLGCCDDGATGIYAVDGATGNLMHRAGDHTHGWDTIASGLTGTSDTILLMRQLADTTILCIHGSSGDAQVDTVLAGVVTVGIPFAFPTDEFNKSVTVFSGSSSSQQLESAFTVAAGGGA